MPSVDVALSKAGMSLSMEILMVRPLIETSYVLSDLYMTLCGPLYGGSSARRTASWRRKTCVMSFKSLCTNVVGDECRAADVGLRRAIWRLRSRRKVEGSTLAEVGLTISPGIRSVSP